MIRYTDSSRETGDTPAKEGLSVTITEDDTLAGDVSEENPDTSKPGNGKKRKKRAPHLRWDHKQHALKLGTARTSVWRIGVQGAFVLLSVYLGWRFVQFVEVAKTTTTGPLPHRPPGVEGYLPISGLMGLLDWIYQGTLNRIHPAATMLFVLFVLLSFLLRKSFCGWLCPVGVVSEWLARLGQVIFGRNFRLPRIADILLRGIKYLLLGFFVWAIVTMTPDALRAFIESPYNKVSDIKMLEFFINLTLTGVAVLAALVIGSVFIQGFWCRYMCPYGALLGIFSWFSPVKVRRNAENCTDCGICDAVCPARLDISTKPSVYSEECIGCTDCVVSCPVPNTLRMGTKRWTLSPKTYAIVLVSLFLTGYIAARSLGWWENDLSDDEIRYHVSRMHSTEYGHPGGSFHLE